MASSSTSIARSFDVFLSFRGEDTRRNFTDHLYSNLVAYGIHTFRDDEELEKGGDVASDLSKAIEESRIFFIIFSKRFAQSRWCLNEVVKIMECKNPTQKESTAIPVFYHVDPSDVRKQSGSFADAFAYHEKDADEEKKEMIQKWRIALEKAANLSGYHVDDQKYESEVIEEIREVVIKRLHRKPLCLGDNIVGMSYHLEQLRSLIKTELDGVRMIGIYGTGGIGKTTIAMAVYNDISSQFDGTSFLRDVGKKSKDDLLELQQKLLYDVLKGKGKMPKFIDTSEGINVIKERLCSKKVLIILDDVDELEQLENLAGKYGWFGAKSRIIITTKDTHLLALHGVNVLYEVKELNHGKAIELFNWCAFKQNIPILKEDFESLSNKVVEYANGLPLALKVLGRLLYGKTIAEWKSALHRLEEMPRKEVNNVLKVSYDKLEEDEKDIFLDIACFFKGSFKDFVSKILGDAAEIAIKILHDRCLISISENKIEMHDLLQRMGWEIVRQQCPKELGGRSRLWKFEDVNSILTRNAGTGAIEGLLLNTYEGLRLNIFSQIKFTTEAFEKMNKLRLLVVRAHRGAIHVPKDFEFPSNELTYLQWSPYPLESLPANFDAKNLILLSLRESHIKQFWKEKKFDKLKVLDLSHSKHLIEIPDFSSMPNLEILHLRECASLESLPSDFCKLEFLEELYCYGCSKLKSFPEIKSNMRKLRLLDLRRSGITEVPSSVGLLIALEYLHLSECEDLASIPGSISSLSSLKALDLDRCPQLNKMEVDLGGLQCLEELKLSFISCEWGYLSGFRHLQELCLDRCSLKQGVIQSHSCLSSLKILNLWDCNPMEGEILDHICHLSSLQQLCLRTIHISRIPAAISGLSNLKTLELFNCQQLLEIPELPPNLRLLDAYNPPGSSSSPFLPLNSLLNCFKSEFQDWSSYRNTHHSTFSHSRCPGIFIRISTISRIPGWIWHKRKGSDIEIELPQKWYENNDFLGFVISFLYVPLPGVNCQRFQDLRCHLNVYGNGQSAKVDLLEFALYTGYPSDLLVICYPKAAIEERYRSDQWTHIKVSFTDLSDHRVLNVKECGVYVIDGCCSDCQQDVKCQRKLCLKGNASSELPTIHHPSQVDSLCLRDCKNLETLPTSICDFTSLTALICSASSQLKSFPEILENRENLRELHLDGTAIQELPSSIQCLTGLLHLNLANCKNLASLPEAICHLKSLEFLSCIGCSQLQTFPEIRENMGNLKVLRLDGTAIKGLPSSIERLHGLQRLDLCDCKNLVSLPETICNLKYFAFLYCFGCLQLKAIPEIPENMGNIKVLRLDGTAIQELPSSIQHLTGLQYLNLANCKNLVNLPEAICHLKSLAFLSCVGCLQLKAFPEILENMGNLRKLHLDGTAIQELPSSIQHLTGLQYLDLDNCKNLVSLPETICHLKSLEFLSCFGCSQLQTFPEIRENMGNLKLLHLGGTAIQELPSSIQHLTGLQILNTANCKNLVSLPETICSLKCLEFLNCLGSLQLKAFPEIMENMGNLRELRLDGTAIQELPSSIQYLTGLRYLDLASCKNLVGLPESICNLSSLDTLVVNFCSKLEKFPGNLGRPQGLQHLGAAGLLPGISQLSKLRVLDLSHCQKLLQIPKLPSSLRILDAHNCSCMESSLSLLEFSLFECLKSAIQEFESGSDWGNKIDVFIPGSNGIPEWISDRKKGSEMVIEVPWDWHHNVDLLGFAFYSVYAPLRNESNEDYCKLRCKLSFYWLQYEFLELYQGYRYSCCRNGGESNVLWVAYCPKDAIMKASRLNTWEHRRAPPGYLASFTGYFDGKLVEAKECGFRLIYTPNKIIQRSHPTTYFSSLSKKL